MKNQIKVNIFTIQQHLDVKKGSFEAIHTIGLFMNKNDYAPL